VIDDNEAFRWSFKRGHAAGAARLLNHTALENDTGQFSAFGFPRALSRFVDSGVYMFHRNLYKLDKRPDMIRVTSSTGGVATGKVSNWLEDVVPLTASPGYKWDFVAREWVPATITLETAERLVRNYPTDAATRDIVDNVDIFLIPSNNPDGANYSFYNFASQRRNMTNHCPDANADPGRRNAWGVDLNRNYRFASGFDGYDGASTSCISDTFQGPSELSEPESQNIIDLVERNRNIKFMMSVHSNGGQLFWQPGAYIAEGRITTPRPPLGHEAYYGQSASRILSQVRASRQTVVTPENVGGSSDVLYSSAGDVREDLYFNYGIFAFGWEVGGSVYNPDTGNFQEGSFQPPWVGIPDLVSGHSETMEYANGVMEMYRIASDGGKDKQYATTELVPGNGVYAAATDVRFETSEPVTIYYTTDGNRRRCSRRATRRPSSASPARRST
jgi:Zinc carboxypeptidase/Chitobiase/beta-hexosaminidase C-terminal domain